MAKGLNGVVLGQVRALFDERAAAGLSDGKLLGRFVEDGGESGEAAFEALVRRHGPLVLGICRRALGDAHRVEDAFQATFLVLASRARSIRDREAVGAWLAGVAGKVAARARIDDLRRRAIEARAAGLAPRLTVVEPEDRDEVNALLREVDQLRRPLREAVVLCHLQGLSYDTAADALGVTEATIRGRLSRARGVLRARLARRGLADDLAGNAPIAPMLLGAVPERLVGLTARASIAIGAGPAASGVVPGSAITLMEGALKSMFFAKLKTTAWLVLGVGLITVGLTIPVHAWQQPKPRKQGEPSKKVQDKEEAPGLADVVEGRIIRTAKVTKDCMVLAYLPTWDHGDVDNIGIGNNGGGVRTLVDWPDVPPSEAKTDGHKFYLAFYARATTANSKPGSILGFEVTADWAERTSWETLPAYEAEPVLTANFEPGEGWKVFDISEFVRDRRGKSGRGLLLRFLNEDRRGSDAFSDYKLISREGDQALRPRLLVVDPAKK